jgi:integrase
MKKFTGNQNRPKKGASIKVYPIRDLQHIETIKENLHDQPRNYCLFVFGINSAFRASEILSITIRQVTWLKVGSVLEVWQKKTQKYRAVTINNSSYYAIQLWLQHHPYADQPDTPFFLSQRKTGAIRVSTLNRLVKAWTANIGLSVNVGSHTLRKTWGYQQRMKGKASVPLLMVAFDHRSERQTLDYLGIQANEVQALYLEMEL